jgi:hypothetical protein
MDGLLLRKLGERGVTYPLIGGGYVTVRPRTLFHAQNGPFPSNSLSVDRNRRYGVTVLRRFSETLQIQRRGKIVPFGY